MGACQSAEKGSEGWAKPAIRLGKKEEEKEHSHSVYDNQCGNKTVCAQSRGLEGL